MSAHLFTRGLLALAWFEVAMMVALLAIYAADRQDFGPESATQMAPTSAVTECYHRAPLTLSQAASVTPAPGTSEAAFDRDCRP